MNKAIAVSGARFTEHGLHLGHYSGCFLSLNGKLSNKFCHYFFIIYDNQITNDVKGIKQFASQIYALSDYLKLNNVHVVLESMIAPLLYKLRHYIESIVTVEQLNASYRQKKSNMHLSASESGRAVSDFMFPLNQASINIALKAKYTCMNDDNVRIVELTKDIIRKINTTCKAEIPDHYLITGYKPHLLGYNYLKMCNGNKNAIYFNDAENDLRFKTHQLFSFKRYFKQFPEQYKLFKSTNEYYYDDNYLPVHFYKALFPNHFNDSFNLMDKNRVLAFEEDLKNRIINLIRSVSFLQLEYINCTDCITDRLQKDYELSNKIISNNDFIE